MIVRILSGIGNPGKLWTGNTPENGAIVDARIFEKKCKCGASTRKLRIGKVENVAAIEAACEIPTLFVTMGGVGSVASKIIPQVEGDDDNLDQFRLWNWSDRVGGHAIVNPVATLSGYWSEKDLPPTKDTHYWVQTYGGTTLSEFVLLSKTDKHRLEVISLEGTCPICRKREEMEKIPEDLMVRAETLVQADLREEEIEEIISDLGKSGEDQGPDMKFSARALLGLAHSGTKLSVLNDKIVKAIEAAKAEVYPERTRVRRNSGPVADLFATTG